MLETKGRVGHNLLTGLDKTSEKILGILSVDWAKSQITLHLHRSVNSDRKILETYTQF